jgi:ParB/Sulfiredoxin domain
MTKLTIREDLRDLIPPLTEQEFMDLQENIERHGIEVPLVYAELEGQKVVIDGHNRLKIAQDLGLEVPVRPFEFRKADPSDEEAKLKEVRLWMIDHVIGQRNVERFELVRLVYLKNRIMFGQYAAKAMSDGGKGGKVSSEDETLEDSQKHKMVSGFSGVSEMTCQRAIFIIDVANGWNRAGEKYGSRREEAKELIEQIRDKGQDMTVTKAYGKLHRPLDEEDSGVEVAIPEEQAIKRLPKLADQLTKLPCDAVAQRAARREDGEVKELVLTAQLASDWLGRFADTLDERTQVKSHRPSESDAA